MQWRYYFFFMCDDIGVAMVTNMIRQLQESFPLRHAAGSYEILKYKNYCLYFSFITLYPSFIDHFNYCTILLFRKWI